MSELVKDGCKTVTQAVAFTAIGRSQLYEMMGRGELRYLMNGNRRLIPVVELRRILVERLTATRRGT